VGQPGTSRASATATAAPARLTTRSGSMEDPDQVTKAPKLPCRTGLLADGLRVMSSWGFRYVSNLVWAKRRKDGGPDGRGVGFYFRNVTELILFGVRGSMRTLAPGRRQVNMIETRKREHSRKPDEVYDIIESCSPGPYLELFARYPRDNWSAWGLEADPA